MCNNKVKEYNLIKLNLYFRINNIKLGIKFILIQKLKNQDLNIIKIVLKLI